MLLAIHEQEKITWMKKLTNIQLRREREERKKQELKKIVKKNVEENKEKALNFQKKYAVQQAAEVIRVFEKMAENNPNMDLKKIRKNVLNNLVERHSDKESDSDYWSMMLLIKLGLIPDPEGGDDQNDPNSAVEMTVEEREQKLKDVGLFLPKKNLEELNKEL